MAIQGTTAQLTPEQIKTFHQEGYMVIDRLFRDEDLAPVIDEISAEVDKRARALHAAGELSRLYDEEGFETRLAQISRETDKVALAIWDGVLHGPAMFNLIRNENLLRVACQLCGTEELSARSVYRLRPKVPFHRHGPVPWHQDSGYFEPYCDKALVLTVWIPFVDATPERGCMWVLPRGHLQGKVLHHQADRVGRYLEIPESELPAGLTPRCTPVKKGGALLMTNLTPHASFENSTGIVRWSMDLRYQSAALPTNARITRLEGETVGDEGRGVPVACFPPEADFLVHSRARPEQVLRDPVAFARLRETHGTHKVTKRWGEGSYKHAQETLPSAAT